MPKHYLWTIGCQMNKAESERLVSYLEAVGFEATNSAEAADLILLNSCVVRQSAENKVINKLNALRSLKKKHPEAKIALTGCLVDSNLDELKKRFPQVDFFMKPGEHPFWLGETQLSHFLPCSLQASTFVPIIYGCNNFCSYCIVPYRRGRERSRPIAEIKEEVRKLARRGTKEVTLLGQNVDSYGQDLEDKPDLADLLTELNKIEGLLRIRFLTNHPKDMSAKLVETVAQLDKVCKALSLPVQSGSNKILKAMGRGYTRESYLQLIKRIRNCIPEIALSTDIIVGFPKESEEDFQETVRLLSEVKFDSLHVAVYSPRPETLAARELEDNVPPSVKRARLDAIEKLHEGIACEINARLRDKTVTVLVEGKRKEKWYGRTESDKLVFFDAPDCYKGRLVNIRISHTRPWALTGKPDNPTGKGGEIA